jgi:hypothetical protein
MGRNLPNIDNGRDLIKRQRLAFKEFVLNVNKDTFIYSFNPDTLILDETNTFFTLTLINKKIIIDRLQVDDFKDYIDVYLFGVKQPQDRYSVEVSGNNIIVTFFVDITRVPTDVLPTNFEIKGKISEIL